MRLGGPWSFKVFGYTVSENFWPAILFLGIAFGVITLWPWIERRLTRDRAAHHLLDRPRDVPARSATGVAGLLLFFIPFLAGGNDIIAVLLHVPVETIIRILQYSFFIAPVVAWLVTFWVCQSLRSTHPAPGGGDRDAPAPYRQRRLRDHLAGPRQRRPARRVTARRCSARAWWPAAAASAPPAAQRGPLAPSAGRSARCGRSGLADDRGDPPLDCWR